MNCACGLPLHYTNKEFQAEMQELSDKLGEFVTIKVLTKGTWKVQRHYIALHGIKADELDKLGFQKVK